MRVLIAYDGSQSASTSVRAAAGLFPDASASIVTVPGDPTVHVGTSIGLASASPDVVTHVIDGMVAEARAQADELAQKGVEQAKALGLDAEAMAIPPSVPAWAALRDAARRLDADVLVSGTRGRGAFARAVLGSTSSSLLHNAERPLLVVPDGSGGLDGPVVVAYDGSDGARRAIAVAGRLMPGRRAVVVHGWEPMFSRELTARGLTAAPVDDFGDVVSGLRGAIEAQAIATTEEGVDAARAAGLDAVGDTVEADDGAWRAVAAAARAHGAAAIVLGARGLGAARSVLLGSVSSGLVHNAELPILVVPGEASPDD